MTTDDKDRAEAFDAAERDARTVVEATAAALGATEDAASAIDNVTILLRITGPGPARQCGHLTGPTAVYLHPAIGVHMCSECASLPATREAIEEHMPTGCDSCGDREATLTPCQFTVTNIVVSAYVCDRCRSGERPAVLPDWARNLPRDAQPPPDS